MTIRGDIQATIQSSGNDHDRAAHNILDWLTTADVLSRLYRAHDNDEVDGYVRCVETVRHICGERI